MSVRTNEVESKINRDLKEQTDTKKSSSETNKEQNVKDELTKEFKSCYFMTEYTGYRFPLPETRTVLFYYDKRKLNQPKRNEPADVYLNIPSFKIQL